MSHTAQTTHAAQLPPEESFVDMFKASLAPAGPQSRRRPLCLAPKHAQIGEPKRVGKLAAADRPLASFVPNARVARHFGDASTNLLSAPLQWRLTRRCIAWAQGLVYVAMGARDLCVGWHMPVHLGDKAVSGFGVAGGWALLWVASRPWALEGVAVVGALTAAAHTVLLASLSLAVAIDWPMATDIVAQMGLVGFWLVCLRTDKDRFYPDPSLAPRPGRPLYP